MEFSEDFKSNSLFTSYLFENDFPTLDEATLVEIFHILLDKGPTRCKTLLMLIDEMVSDRFLETKKGLEYRAQYAYYANEIVILRYQIKYLVSGLIQVSSNYHEFTRKDLSKLLKIDFQNHLHGKMYELIIIQFEQIQTEEDVDKFIAEFKNFLILLILDLCQMFLVRGKYTIAYLTSLHILEEDCRVASLQFEECERLFNKCKV